MTSPQTGRIFINYRRVDSQAWAGRIYDRLAVHFGRDALFMDVDAMDAGIDFVQYVEDAVQSCDVLIALIGDMWLTVKDEEGNRRLDNPEDYVRIEIEAALKRNIRVIPILVGGISMPKSANLPGDLKPLSRHNALTVYHHTFNADMDRLINQLERALEAAENSKVLKAKRVQEELARKEREAQIDRLRHQANTAISLADWQLAQEKLKQILALDVKDIKAQADLEIVEKKIIEFIEQAEKEQKEKAEKDAEEKFVQETEERERAERVTFERLNNEIAEEIKQENKQHNDANSAAKIKANYQKIAFRRFGIAGVFILLLMIGLVGLIPLLNKPPIETVEPTSQVFTETAKPLSETEVLITPTLESTGMVVPIPTLGIGSKIKSEIDGMTLIYVPAGEFTMGNNDNSYPDEAPETQIYLPSFWIDRTEITNQEYAICVNNGECRTLDTSDFQDNGRGDYPVVFVSWNDANSYCLWAGRRLPTEAEWEKAARGIKGSKYPWGNAPPQNFLLNFNNHLGNTSEVGDCPYGISEYGSLDMAGNVWEWVSSLFNVYPYDATDGREDLSKAGFRVLRGGSWKDSTVRSNYRFRLEPDKTTSNIGFRCAMDATP